ncbi:MAG: alpha-ketoglutarate-dependent dioxygenase AlkB [Acaryochloridaceae cyanobacterium RU_4_10]|nr:alpha-ketoglutarate-dependent dioxygenase AlkB [Acaryochloridaceae cyanobacterium RU_4_10]
MQQLALLANIDSPPVQYWPGFLNQTQADNLLEQSLALNWQQNQMKMFGRPVPLPRLESMFGDSPKIFYTYSSSVELHAKPWPIFLSELRAQVEAQTGYRFKLAIGNQYRSAQDSIGYHADDEPTLGIRPAIASISLGSTRSFKMKRKNVGQTHSFDLSHGDLLLMEPSCQDNWVHAVPKASRSCGVRVNWTFRPYLLG